MVKMSMWPAMILAVAVAWGAAPAEAGWFSHTFHSVTHTVSKVANKTADTIKDGGEIVVHTADKIREPLESGARNLCKTVLPSAINPVIGQSCKAAGAEAGTICNAELDLETEGAASPACDALGIILAQSCRRAGSAVKKAEIDPAIKSACNKI